MLLPLLPDSAALIAIGISIVNVVMTFPAILLVDVSTSIPIACADTGSELGGSLCSFALFWEWLSAVLALLLA